MLYPIALSYLQKAFINLIMEKSLEMVPVSFKFPSSSIIDFH